MALCCFSHAGMPLVHVRRLTLNLHLKQIVLIYKEMIEILFSEIYWLCSVHNPWMLWAHSTHAQSIVVGSLISMIKVKTWRLKMNLFKAQEHIIFYLNVNHEGSQHI